MTTATDKIAGAPISWGVCEVPGWGYQLPPERVLTEMHQVGLAATEFGPDGFLPADPAILSVAVVMDASPSCVGCASRDRRRPAARGRRARRAHPGRRR